ncbi:unnamed protein product, partial [Closterium sp. NIES-54]
IYSPDAYRGFAREFIKDLEAIRPRAILDIIKSAEDFRFQADAKMPTQRTCDRCGYISSQELCKACVLLEGLNRGLPRLGVSRTRRKDGRYTAAAGVGAGSGAAAAGDGGATAGDAAAASAAGAADAAGGGATDAAAAGTAATAEAVVSVAPAASPVADIDAPPVADTEASAAPGATQAGDSISAVFYFVPYQHCFFMFFFFFFFFFFIFFFFFFFCSTLIFQPSILREH